MAEMTKEDKLKHYANRELKKFLQYGFYTNVLEDGITKPGEGGDALWLSVTHELMTGVPAVRVLIVPGTPEKEVVRGLLKVIEAVNKYGLDIEEMTEASLDYFVEKRRKEAGK